MGFGGRQKRQNPLVILSPSERVSGPGRADHWLREAVLGVGVQLSWKVWWSGYWAQALGPLGRTGSHFIRAADCSVTH